MGGILQPLDKQGACGEHRKESPRSQYAKFDGTFQLRPLLMFSRGLVHSVTVRKPRKVWHIQIFSSQSPDHCPALIEDLESKRCFLCPPQEGLATK